MDTSYLCESVSAAIHGAALIAAVPATIVLLRRGERAVRWPLLVYGLGLIACFAASTACHALTAAGHVTREVVALDHMAIYLLIAGTYSPIVAALLPVGKRRAALRVVWMAAAVGVALDAARGPLPPLVATGFYMAIGWGGLWCYAGMRPVLSHRQLATLPIGGAFYTAGAALHVSGAPVVWAGVFESHELFHVLVVVGAAAHFAFILANATAIRPEVAAVVLPRRLAPIIVGPVPATPSARRPAAGAAWGNLARRRSRGAFPPPQR